MIYPDLTSDRCWKHTCFPRDVGLPFTQVVLSDHGEKLIVPRTHAYLPPSHLIFRSLVLPYMSFLNKNHSTCAIFTATGNPLVAVTIGTPLWSATSSPRPRQTFACRQTFDLYVCCRPVDPGSPPATRATSTGSMGRSHNMFLGYPLVI